MGFNVFFKLNRRLQDIEHRLQSVVDNAKRLDARVDELEKHYKELKDIVYPAVEGQTDDYQQKVKRYQQYLDDAVGTVVERLPDPPKGLTG